MNKDWLAVFETLRRVYTEGAYSNMALTEALFHHKGCKESFVRNYAKGVLRNSIWLDYHIDKLASRGIAKVDVKPLIILRMGIYAIEKLGSVPEHAAVSESVELCKTVAKGAAGFVNGVLRSYLRKRDEFAIPDDRLDIKYSINAPVVNLLKSQYGAETEDILKGLSENPPLVIRPNRLKISREDAVNMLMDMGLEAAPCEESQMAVSASGSGIVASNLYKSGMISLQSLSSMMAIEALNPAPDSKVLDMCAAPGGKSAYMAEIMDNRGSIIACDIHKHRLELINNSMKRLGIDIVETELSDGTAFNEKFESSFEYVLADVPCSGLGVMNTKPEIRFQSNPDDYEGLIEIQKAILQNAISYAKPGGRIEYSTCTLNKDENEKVIESIMDGEAGTLVSVLEMKTLLPYNCKVGFFYAILEKNL